jgi:hypothetical protein
MFCSKHFLLLMHNRQRKTEKSTPASPERKELAGYYNREIQQKTDTDNDQFVKLIKNQFEFTLTIDRDNLAENSFGFLVACVVDKKLKFNWSLAKIE